ncbi:LysM peptidoglycan-binding domain-containing protein [Flavobacterium amnicola]|uniref:Peptidoglycan hydrolase n=1 Tax=Flavobacterium amnicola TaxID=2506422 RepID=A0A4V1N248_9FLAO|nr:glucosaminidase domain-containing protein [Flavobacterium amnicola]RXR20471.1 LysM peptidoglycan-binding domain-containing protein [Flavobacterium amnicola]
MNKIFYILIAFSLLGCGASKPKIQASRKPVPSVVATKKKSIKPEDRIIIDESRKTEELIATSKVKVTAEIVNAYINQFKEIAKNNMKEHGIPASITLAQGILESGAGTGKLANVANNHFGIKCHKEWSGDSVRHDDDAAQECFRKYEQPGESYRDHSLFLTSRPWYNPLFKLEKNDFKGWAYGLKKSGYATDPKYPEKLIGIINRYQLQRFDSEVLGIEYVAPNATSAVPVVALKTEIKKEEIAELTHTVLQGETLYAISKKYNISIEVLKTKNNLVDNAISIGQTLIIK